METKKESKRTGKNKRIILFREMRKDIEKAAARVMNKYFTTICPPENIKNKISSAGQNKDGEGPYYSTDEINLANGKLNDWGVGLKGHHLWERLSSIEFIVKKAISESVDRKSMVG